MNNVWLLMGANLGNETELFAHALLQIEEKIGACVKKSSMYNSPPWGFSHANMFYNQAIEIKTELSAEIVLHQCLSIEQALGRTRDAKPGYQARSIDIDILYYNNSIIESHELTIPHKLLHTRRFTLLPLCEIAPLYTHPFLHKTNVQLLAECTDASEVTMLLQE